MPRVAVVGCGTAGPAAALNIIRRLGPRWRVDLFDKTREPSAVGAGIGIQPIGMTAAHKLGILGGLLAHGARVDEIQTWSQREGGRRVRVLDVAYERYDARLFGLGLHRGVLFELLLRACLARPDAIEPRFGVELAEVEQTADGGGSVDLRDVSGARHGPYDLAVLADGASSRLRGSLGVPHAFRRYEYGALFALIPDPQRTFGSTLTQAHAGPGCHTTLGFLPTGYAHGDAGGTFRTTLYFSLRHDEYADWAAAGLDAWRRQCAKLMPEAAPLLDRITRMDQLAFATYSDGSMWRFHTPGGRVVVLGDASHAMSPQLGQGANLAMIDAEKLVDQLVEKSGGGGRGGERGGGEGGGERGSGGGGGGDFDGECDIPAALAAYTSERWWRVAFYQAQSRLLTPLFASRSEPLRLLRDNFTRAALHAPGIKQFAHGVLCGAQSPRLLGTIPEHEYLGFLDGLRREGIDPADAGVR